MGPGHWAGLCLGGDVPGWAGGAAQELPDKGRTGPGQVLSGHPPCAGWAHERPMGSSHVDGALSPLSQPDQDAGGPGRGWEGRGSLRRPEPLTAHLSTDPPEDTGAAKPRAALLERHLLGGEKQPPSTGSGPFFYIGGTNGVAM